MPHMAFGSAMHAGSLNLQVHITLLGQVPKSLPHSRRGYRCGRQLLQPVMRPFYYGSNMELIPHEIGE